MYFDLRVQRFDFTEYDGASRDTDIGTKVHVFTL